MTIFLFISSDNTVVSGRLSARRAVLGKQRLPRNFSGPAAGMYAGAEQNVLHMERAA